MKSTWLRALGLSCATSALALVAASGCSKDNQVNTDNSICGKVPAGTCPEGFAAVIVGESSIADCQMDGEGECKSVGKCTVRCEDPRGCTAEGSVCSGDNPACCGESVGEYSCINFDGDKSVCAKRCTANADCPNTCCDGSINNGTYAACAPYNMCIATGGLPDACRACLETECPDDLAACFEDEVCTGCANGDIYPLSPDCRNNPALRRGYGCALQKCPGVCEM